MLNTSLAPRYGRAIFKIAQTLGTAPKVSGDLAEISRTIDGSADLKRVLYHPGITPDEKKRVIAALFASSCENATIKFIDFLIDKKRIFFCTSISRCVSELLDEYENKVKVTVESFGPLPGETLKKIRQSLATKLGKEIIIDSEVNPSLLGGMRLILGDRVIDGSIAFQLKKLSETIAAF
jgi:F-type H+-transporting ATPase subunit delta